MTNTSAFPRSIIIRGAQPCDKNFIYSTWLRGYYYGNDWTRDIGQDLYFEYYHKIISHIISKPNTQILVACLQDDPEIILAYVVLEARPTENAYTLHWAFTKAAWRKVGLMKDLIPKSTDECSHLTKLGKSLKPKAWIYNPFRV